MDKVRARKVLEQVKKRIRKNPSSYDQNSFCGTICCIAGHIDIVVNGLRAHVKRKISYEIPRICGSAIGCDKDHWLFGPIQTSEELELKDEDYDPSDRLWTPDLSDKYANDSSAKSRAAVACEAIDRYMEEQGI